MNFRRFTVAKSGSCGPAASVMACITDICYVVSVRHFQNSSKNFISNAAILLSDSAFRVQLSHPYVSTDTTKLL